MTRQTTSKGGRNEGTPDFEEVLSAAFGALPELRKKLAGIVETVARHDLAHGTDLVRTLEAFVDTDRSVAATANRLGVHRHTVINRLMQAERIVGRRLRKGRDRYILELALIAGGRWRRP